MAALGSEPRNIFNKQNICTNLTRPVCKGLVQPEAIVTVCLLKLQIHFSKFVLQNVYIYLCSAFLYLKYSNVPGETLHGFVKLATL